eukprot:m.220822 g.220822  ORF g.220822 m.220822 type:complete len:452 (+) comp39949_c0_seq21:69-1424(+)
MNLVYFLLHFAVIFDFSVWGITKKGHLAAFKRWLRKGGGYLSESVSIEDCGEMGLGIKAKEALEPGHVVTRVPLSLLINIEHAATSLEFSPILDKLSYLSDINAMAAFLAFERNSRKSKWQPYIDLLPEKFTTTLFATEEELEELEGSYVLDFITKRNEAVQKVYGRFSHDMEAFFPNVHSQIAKDEFLWGLSVLWSRTHRVGVLGPDGQWHQTACLVPVADLFNMAANERDASIDCKTNDKSTHFECFTVSVVAANAQLFVTYGSDPLQRHNSRLLMDYGFVLENNPHDCVTIGKPTPDDEDADKDIRSTVLSWVPALQTPYIQLYRLNQTELLKSPLMTAMRILVMPKNSLEDLYKMKHEKKQQINKIGSLPPPDEIKVLQKAIGYIETHLSRYPVEDTEAFGAKAAFPTQLRKRMVTLRKEEKQMLLSILRELQLQAQRVVRLLSGEL